MTDRKITRRSFNGLGLGSALIATPVVASSPTKKSILGVNDRIRIAVVGLGRRGVELLERFQRCSSVELAGFSDVDSVALGKALEKFNPKGRAEKDFRKLLEPDTKIDAVVIATPDHWHAFQTIESCKANKDVYLERPISLTIHEGRLVVTAAKKYKRIVQVGFQKRSDPFYQKLFDDPAFLWRIGSITVARSYWCENMTPRGIGMAKFAPPPATLDWDLWLGPRYRPWQENIAPYKFRWYSEFSSPLAAFGLPRLDLVRWAFRENAPLSVSALDSGIALSDDRTTPVSIEIAYRFGSKRLLTFSLHQAAGNPVMATDEKFQPLGDLEFRGTNGTLYIGEDRYQLKKETIGQFQSKKLWRLTDKTFKTDPNEPKKDPTFLHIQNFLEAVRSRSKPVMDAESARQTSLMSQMVDVALITGMKLDWDPHKEVFSNFAPANELLHYEYRAPWKLEV